MTRERGCAGTVVHRRAVFSGWRWRGEIVGCVVADGEVIPSEVENLICGGCILMVLPLDVGRWRMGICDDRGSEREILLARPCALACECG